MSPIEKNILVVDESGNRYGTTYLKRAKGLVKKGRARFINENSICLACPPILKTEDNTMSENKDIKTATVAEEITLDATSPKLTVNYVLEQIEKIQAQNDHIGMALASLGNLIPKENTTVPDVATAEQAEAIAEVVEARESTNRKLIELYSKMYDDIKPKEDSVKVKAIDMLRGIVSEISFYDTEEGAQLLSDILDTIRHIS